MPTVEGHRDLAPSQVCEWLVCVYILQQTPQKWLFLATPPTPSDSVTVLASPPSLLVRGGTGSGFGGWHRGAVGGMGPYHLTAA